MTSRKKKLDLVGIKEFLLPRSKNGKILVESGSARVLFGPTPERDSSRKDRGLVNFLKQVNLFKEFSKKDLNRLARVVHERTYRDGEYIYEQGNPGVALYIVRSGVVEISRRKQNGEEVPLVRLGPPDSLEELAAMGADVVRWTSAKARGPVSLVAIGRSDLDALSHNFPFLANKILMNLAQTMAMRMQGLLEVEYLNEENESWPPVMS
jgi:CRP/FNR family transcriptional regulator, cyclic AMP receptor protein